MGCYVTAEEAEKYCPACADKIRSGSLKLSCEKFSEMIGSVNAAEGDKWKKKPKGWTDESRKKFWNNLVGKVKHKVTKCIKKMDGKVDNAGAFCASLADRVEGKEWRSEPRKKKGFHMEAYSYSCLMADLPKEMGDRLVSYGKAIPDKYIYKTEDGEHGREDEPHITVKYGLHTEKVDDVKKVIDGQVAPLISLGSITAFENDDFNVLKIDIDSADLNSLNGLVSDNLECTDSFPDYHPHATIAYLKKDAPLEQFFSEVFKGEQAVLENFTFSNPKDKKFDLKLPVEKIKVAMVGIAKRVAITARLLRQK